MPAAGDAGRWRWLRRVIAERPGCNGRRGWPAAPAGPAGVAGNVIDGVEDDGGAASPSPHAAPSAPVSRSLQQGGLRNPRAVRRRRAAIGHLQDAPRRRAAGRWELVVSMPGPARRHLPGVHGVDQFGRDQDQHLDLVDLVVDRAEQGPDVGQVADPGDSLRFAPRRWSAPGRRWPASVRPAFPRPYRRRGPSSPGTVVPLMVTPVVGSISLSAGGPRGGSCRCPARWARNRDCVPYGW